MVEPRPLRRAALIPLPSWLLAAAALAQPTAQPAGQPAPAAMPTCRYAPPVALTATGSGAATALVAKVCLHRSGSQRLLRHGVELRAQPAGTRLQQASLPAAPTASDALPAPGVVLAGSPPLLVLPHGIAAADLRLGSAEMVFEPQGVLVGAARDGDFLALVEVLPSADRSKPQQLEWTVLDLEAGQVVAQVVLAGGAVDGVALVREKAALYTELRLQGPKASLVLRADILTADGRPAIKDGHLVPRPVASPQAAPAQKAERARHEP